MALLLLRTLCHDCSSVHWLWQRLRYSMWASVLNVDTEGMCGYVLLTKCTRTIGFRGCCHPTLHLGWAILIRRCILFYTGSAGMNRNLKYTIACVYSRLHHCLNQHNTCVRIAISILFAYFLQLSAKNLCVHFSNHNACSTVKTKMLTWRGPNEPSGRKLISRAVGIAKCWVRSEFK